MIVQLRRDVAENVGSNRGLVVAKTAVRMMEAMMPLLTIRI